MILSNSAWLYTLYTIRWDERDGKRGVRSTTGTFIPLSWQVSAEERKTYMNVQNPISAMPRNIAANHFSKHSQDKCHPTLNALKGFKVRLLYCVTYDQWHRNKCVIKTIKIWNLYSVWFCQERMAITLLDRSMIKAKVDHFKECLQTESFQYSKGSFPISKQGKASACTNFLKVWEV